MKYLLIFIVLLCGCHCNPRYNSINQNKTYQNDAKKQHDCTDHDKKCTCKEDGKCCCNGVCKLKCTCSNCVCHH